ncbi:MAG: sulfite exporter TauE/SafE family protein [Gammaproteobacteria bacterium]
MNADGGLVAAFLAGLFGSTHCLAMCGGIAGWLGLNTAVKGAAGRSGFAIAYNGGRVTGYLALGAIAGFAGATSGGLLGIRQWGPLLRLVFGLVIVLIGLQLAFGWNPLRRFEAWGARGWRRLAPLTGRLLPATTPLHAFALGVIWGWIPCGLVYSVLLAAAVSGGASQGAVVMAAFGLGTLPSMLLATGGAARLAGLTRRTGVRRLAGALVILAGLWTMALPVMHLADLSGHGGHGPSSMPAEHAGH